VITLDAGGRRDRARRRVFGVEPRADILHRVVRWQLAKRQAGTHKAKTRGETATRPRRSYRQKGTGGARHGDAQRAAVPQWRHRKGRCARSHAHDLPKKVRALGLKMALSAKAKDGSHRRDRRGEDGRAQDQGAGREADQAGLEARAGHRRGRGGRQLREAGRAQHRDVDVLPSAGANVYDILKRDTLVLTKAGVEALQERLK
jgi:large subunit ribosomal protein L4